jgi:fucokinase / fucose-1-phosphate guanylyltransferase
VTTASTVKSTSDLATVAQRARRLYAARVADMPSAPPWWSAVVITASSARQAERYQWELHRREEAGKIPANVRYLVVPDLADQPLGSGGATLNALRVLVGSGLTSAALAEWWSKQRVLMIHSGGDSRTLPQYSLSGKLFSVVPVKTPWGDASTVLDETLALSTAWVEKMPAGLVVGSGDVILTFDADGVDWTRPGVCGVAMLQPAESGTRHGVYVTDDQGRVYAFLQKPSVSELRAAGGLLPDDQVALDVGLLRFSPEAAVRLTRLADVVESPPLINIYEHVPMALTGQWKPGPADPQPLHALADALKDLPFWCSTVPGEFTHIGTTTLFRELMTEETEFSRLYAAQQRLGVTRQPGLRSAGVVIDSLLSGGGELGPATVVIDCNLAHPARVASGSVLHGLDGIPGPLEVPENTVIHQVPVATQDGKRGTVIRVYGVEDDPKASVAAWQATWFGRPMIEELRSLGMDLAHVWPGLPAGEWTLWNAQLFPVTTVEDAWACARWLLRISSDYSIERWNETERLSLASSAQWADGEAIEAGRSRRLKAHWRTLALSLAASGTDVRPLLAHAPGIGPLAETGKALHAQAGELEAASPTEAASRYYTAGLFFGQAGLAQEARDSHATAFHFVEQAVKAGSYAQQWPPAASWQSEEVLVEGPARIDLGGGWSDTPPFCLDWGGTVLNIGVLLNGAYPIRTTIRRLSGPVLRCVSAGDGEAAEYVSCDEVLEPSRPGDPFSIPRTALQMTGLFQPGAPLADILARMGGGLEIETAVELPMGSGLGTSSILSATTLRALAEMMGVEMDNQSLADQVMRLEQLMTTGGGWQDQAGGIFPGAKLVASGPGLHQRLRVQPVPWSVEREAEFEALTVLFYTGIRRVARDLLQQVVGSYLGRETACLQVLHSIKTLAMEMSHAMREGDWAYLGSLLDRHWELNRVLDPNTTNAPITLLLEAVRPFIHGVKLAGAGGGGFLILLARAGAVEDLKRFLNERAVKEGGAIYDWKIAREGLRVVRH